MDHELAHMGKHAQRTEYETSVGEPKRLEIVEQDAHDMARMGQVQLLKRYFHPLSTLGLVMVIMETWLGMISLSTFALENSGRGGTIWLYIITWIFQIPSIASMAEMASMAPTSSGMYHWVSEFSPPSMEKFLSYVSGWLSACGWQALIAGDAYSAAQFVLILASLDGSYVPKPWHTCLLTIGWALFCVFFNIWGARWLPTLEGIILLTNIIGFFGVCIPLWILAPKASSADVWTTFTNGGGWASAGGATIVGLISTSGAFLGADAAAHMSEETKNASINIPRIMFGAMMLNGVMGFVSLLTYIYCVQDVTEQIINSTETFPFIGVFKVSTNSTAGAIGLTVPWAIIAITSCMNAIAAGSRQAWAFSRDGGLPFSSWFYHVKLVSGVPLPINSIFATLIITVILALVALGSSEAFNTIVGLAGGAISFAYALSIGCVLWRRLYGAPLPPARWSLGRWGVPCNLIGCLFQIVCTVMNFFPTSATVTGANMNYAVAMFGGVAVISSIYYAVHGRKVYAGPVGRVKRE